MIRHEHGGCMLQYYTELLMQTALPNLKGRQAYLSLTILYTITQSKVAII